MELQKASKKKAKIKMALQGPSGSGKTMSSLLIAYGLCGSWDRIAVVDSEHHSSDLYADLGTYNVLPITAPFTPEKYILAIDKCLAAGMDVIIIDSLSHLWDGAGGILDIHSAMMGNSFANWSKVTPRYNAFVQHMLQCDAHIIGTLRTKQDYVLNEKNGKQVIEKVGLKSISKDGLDYEFTLVLDIDLKHNATASKDRTGLYADKPQFIPTIDTGAQLLLWCNTGTETVSHVSVEDILQAIDACTSITELSALYYQFPAHQDVLKNEYSKKKDEIINSINQQKHLQNGAAAITN
jgi:hypothetical protein